MIEASKLRLLQEANKLAIEQQILKEIRMMERADAEAEHLRMILMMEEREIRRRRSSDMVILYTTHAFMDFFLFTFFFV